MRSIVVNRREYAIDVNSDGEFTAHVAGDYIKHDTMAATIAEIRRKAKKLEVKIAVRVTVLGHGRFTGVRWHRKHVGDVHHGDIVEYDNESSAYKIRFDDGGVETLSRFDGHHDFLIAKPMSGPEVKEWERLRKERDAASERFNKYARRFEFKDIHGVVKAAYEAAIDTPNEDDVDETDDPRLQPEGGKRGRTKAS